jgi:hypothetical protein
LLTQLRVRALEPARRGRVLHGELKEITLGKAAELHLIAKTKSGRHTTTWIGRLEAYLRRGLGFLGTDRDPNSVTVELVRQLVSHLRGQSSRRGGTMGDGNVRHHLNALSGRFRRAASGYVPPGSDPVAALIEKPVRRVYAHLGTIRHCSEVVEYRVEQHTDTLGDRLEALKSVGMVTTDVTRASLTLRDDFTPPSEVLAG